MGKSGCGKSHLERNLIRIAPNKFKKVVSSTTRPIRPSEVHGQDYYFLSDKEYDATDFIQITKFAEYRYGSSVAEYTTEHEFPILVVVPESARFLAEVLEKRFPSWEVFYIYFDISTERQAKNMRTRGDTEDMITKRIPQDSLDKEFENTGIIADFVVSDDDLNEKLPFSVYNSLTQTYK